MSFHITYFISTMHNYHGSLFGDFIHKVVIPFINNKIILNICFSIVSCCKTINLIGRFYLDDRHIDKYFKWKPRRRAALKEQTLTPNSVKTFSGPCRVIKIDGEHPLSCYFTFSLFSVYLLLQQWDSMEHSKVNGIFFYHVHNCGIVVTSIGGNLTSSLW